MPFRTFPVQNNRAGGYQTWTVTQVSNNVPLASGLANLKKSGELITPMIAKNGVAGGDPPVELYPSDLMMVDPGAIANTFEVLPTGGGVDVLLWGKSLPRGRLDTARIIANVGGITAEQDVGLSVTWDAIATHVYRLEAHARGMTTSLVGNTRVSITDSANTHLVDDDSRTDSAGIVPAGTHLFTDVEGVSGTVTYKVRAAVLTGGGTGTLAATPEARLSVYDMGSA